MDEWTKSTVIISSLSLCLWAGYWGVAWLGGAGSGFLNEVSVRCQLGLHSWKGPKVALSHGWQAGADCWQEATALLHRGLSTDLLEYLHAVVAGFPQHKHSWRPR